MSRLMSVAFTEAAVVTRQKTVTRRLGWRFAKPGDTVTLCRKVMGRKPGEPLIRLAEVEIVDVRRERLSVISPGEVRREGFDASPDWFVAFWVEHMGGSPDQLVTRIEWRYLASPPTLGNRPDVATPRVAKATRGAKGATKP